MTQTNPFAADPLVPSAAPRPLPALPGHLVAVALSMSVIAILLSMIGWWRSDLENDFSVWLSYVAPYWVNHLLMAGLGVYWLTSAYLERHRLAGYRQPAPLLVSYGVVYLLLSWGLGFVSGQLYMWLYELLDDQYSGRLLTSLGWSVIGLLSFCLEVLAPLWLLLQLFRRSAEVTDGELQMAGTSLAWCFALAIMVGYLQVMGLALELMDGAFYGFELESWAGVINLLHGGVYMLVAFFAARSALPEQVRGFRGGRLALAALITLSLWIAGALLCAIIMLVLLLVVGVSDLLLLLLFGLVQLALLWPFSRLGLRWGYRAQPVQG
ncbi:hypothetical protein [Ectopseudomonas khazarica]|uniref:hypothetical protein n=1 Tax=Ectopseudomonas khazarica TaxID=2502979 RepID=UPI0037C98C8A